ncbi:hypothetical protein [Acinetobacter haemolyticus]|uniref:hypothetical protein n=1 Tax=Acinetobacter haemolyticus TaxID=29430 RepID=UPI002DBE1BA4|nr:hypothetical protein [Acinetobacter haemolyticus]MEB6677735.1 hypothetical protein [Acinetobacter haemolyticus]
MGENFQFLVNRVGSNLNEAIDLLEDSSSAFVTAWQQSDFETCHITSDVAFKNFDFIINEILRKRDALDESCKDEYTNNFKEILAKKSAKKAEIDDITQMASIFTIQNNGHAQLPNNQIVYISLSRLLNTIKHRNTMQLNFRIQERNHILVIGANEYQNKPKSLVEFSVKEFCDSCREVAKLVSSKAP